MDIQLVFSPTFSKQLGCIQYRAWRKAYKGLLPDEVLDMETESIMVEKWKVLLTTAEKWFNELNAKSGDSKEASKIKPAKNKRQTIQKVLTDEHSNIKSFQELLKTGEGLHCNAVYNDTIFPPSGLTLVAFMDSGSSTPDCYEENFKKGDKNDKYILGYLRFGVARSHSEYLQECYGSGYTNGSSNKSVKSTGKDNHIVNAKKENRAFLSNEQLLNGNSDLSTQNNIEIYSLYVDPLYQRKGVGKKLLNTCLDIVKDINVRCSKKMVTLDDSNAIKMLDHIDNVILWVGVPNVLARKFYEKNGAKRVPDSYRESAYGWRGGMVCYNGRCSNI